MSLLPVFQQPTRARADGAANTSSTGAADRRTTDVSRDQFAASLASARSDRAPAAECAAVRSDRVTLATAAPDSEEYAAAKQRIVVAQRAQVSALMLSGAMKFAATRNDPATSTVLSDGTMAQPDVITLPAADDAVALATPVATAPNCATTALPADDATPPTVANIGAWMTTATLPPEVSVQAMPERTTLDDASTADAVAADASSVIASAGTGFDASASTAATVAALQLIATLPIAAPAPTPEPAASVESHTDTTSSTVDRPASSLTLDAAATSLPERSDVQLVEDHFDAPAAALAAAVPTVVAQPSTTVDTVVTPASTYTSRYTTTGELIARDSTAADADAATVAARADTPAASTTAATAATLRATTASPADVTSMQTDIAKLDPEFRSRLQKVIDRMRDEFGHAVKVVETVRSQARQDALFAQGRTEPGPVVTWTRNSRHAKGMAADLMVDGAWQNPEGYAHLADVAKQEGLRTLGARDPGHVELPSDASVSGETLGNLLGDLQGEAGDAARQLRAEVNTGVARESRADVMTRVANVAQVARVATVASVAQVARVAPVARPGAPSSQGEAVSPLAVSAVPSMVMSGDATSALRVATPLTGVNMSDRITHLLDLQATQDAKPLNSVLLRMNDASGIEDQIRIDTRGTSVDARLGLGNAQQAAALTDRLGELREALERRGLTADGVRVQAASSSRGIDSATFARPTAPTLELAAMRAAADSQAQGNPREQATRDQAHREAFAREQSRNTPRPSSDDARQRSRREQPEERR